MNKAANGRSRPMALTAELVASCHRDEPDRGPEMKYEYWDYPRYDAAVSALLAQRPPGPVWIFAYGSLIWKPEMQHTEHRRGVIHGWHRSFCINLTRWRGSPEQPG